MTRIVWTCVFVACLASPCRGEQATKKKTVPLYTNEDLRRVSVGEQRSSRAASAPEAEPPSPPEPQPERGEAYWRRQADQTRERLLPLRASAAELTARIAAANAESPRRRGTEGRVAGWESRLHALQLRIRSIEASFEERARRAGALPGWLR